MAITIETVPQNFTTANNPCVFTFSSTETAQTNFSFYVELTINAAVHSFHEVFPESNNYGKFDASELLRTVVFSDLVTDGSLDTIYDDAIASYSIRVRDKYGDPVALQGSYVGSSTVRCINGALRHEDWISYDHLDYDMATTINSLYLTGFPRMETYWCGLNESMFLGSFMTTAVAVDLNVLLYDVNDVLIASDFTALAAGYLKVTDVSPQSIITNTAITAGNFDTCFYYLIQNSLGGGNTEAFKIYVDNECTQYTQRRLHWLNKFGVWDSYSFILHSETSANVVTSSYEREKGQWSTTNTWDYNQYRGQGLSYSKTAKDSMLINSDWIKEAKQQWLVKSLYESPKVYLEVSQGVFEPVTITKTSYKQKNRIKDKLIREDLTIERTYTYKSQLG